MPSPRKKITRTQSSDIAAWTAVLVRAHRIRGGQLGEGLLGALSLEYDFFQSDETMSSVVARSPRVLVWIGERSELSDVQEFIRASAPEGGMQVVVVADDLSSLEQQALVRQGAFWAFSLNETSPEEFASIVNKAYVISELLRENSRLQSLIMEQGQPQLWRSNSPLMKDLLQRVDRIASIDSTILLRGETGAGKTSLARTIHGLSARHAKPFLSISCAAIPEDLLEGELFGYERGAFTGATKSHIGMFEAASGGTIFLDEIGDLPLALQPKLLAVLQDHRVRRLGSTRSIPVDIRVIAATNRPLEELVRQGLFREELLFRLDVISLTLPPLRERREDIVAIAEACIHRICGRRKERNRELSSEAARRLEQYSWPGNLRELENVMERTLAFLSGNVVNASDLMFSKSPGPTEEMAVPIPPNLTLRELEQWAIRNALVAAGGSKTDAARRLGISVKTIYNKLEQYAGSDDEMPQR